jgi:amino acid adenylation domain-containing protein
MAGTLLDALANQDYPFALLVERLNPKRDTSRTPIYQTLFVFQKPHNISEFIDVITDFYSGTARVKMGDLDFESFPISQQEGQFDMSIEMTGTAESLKGVLKYNRDVFADATTKRMSEYFLNILESMIENPAREISEIDFMSTNEKHQLLVEWNDTRQNQAVTYVHKLFENQVEKTPHATALVFNDGHLSYSQLNHRANQLAHYLSKKGIGPDERVGICVERSLEMVTGVLGILKASGAYVPMDPQYPRELLSYIIKDSQISVLLANHHLANLFQPGSETILEIDSDWKQVARESIDNPDKKVSPGNLTYIIYTSGSTGRPKGIAMVLQCDGNLIQWTIKISKAVQHTKTLQFTTLNFDISFQEMFTTFGTGGTLLLIREALRHDPVNLLKLLKKESIERIFVPYVYLKMLADTVETDETLLPLSLMELFTAGEQLRITPALVNMFKKLNGCPLHNHYGPTECYVVTGYTLSGDPGNWPLLPPVGKPVDDVRIYILDRYLKPVPQGVTGEIFIGGICLARGYQNLAEMTEKNFIKGPFNNKEHLYRTGDLARYLPDGNIEFLGRSDHQLKIRGFRIEPDEIKNHLLSHQDITDAFVTDHEDKTGVKSLLAYIVSENEKELSVTALKDYLAEKLPNFMVPSFFVKLDKIPRLPSTKVDRSSLPLTDGSVATGIEYVAPGDDVEEKLAGIWQDLLNLEKVGIHDDLFDIGGNSLTTLSIQRKIDEFYPGKVKIPDIIQYPTVSSLANVIKNRESTLIEDAAGRNEQFQNLLEAITMEDS